SLNSLNKPHKPNHYTEPRRNSPDQSSKIYYSKTNRVSNSGVKNTHFLTTHQSTNPRKSSKQQIIKQKNNRHLVAPEYRLRCQFALTSPHHQTSDLSSQQPFYASLTLN